MIAEAHGNSTERRLVSIEAKLDRALERQRTVSEFFDTMSPVAKEMMAVATERLDALERKGYFAAGQELLRILDTIVATYGKDDLRMLGDNMVAILDTVRNVTQSDVLEVANEATDVLHHADDIEPLHRLGLLRSTGDEDVRRGLTIVLEVLRQIGRTRASAPHAALAMHDAPSPRTSRTDARPTPVREPDEAAAAAQARETTVWEGVAFYDDGFLVDPASWTRELGTKIATGLGITLGDEQWKIVDWARADFLDRGASPNVRRVASGSGAGTSALYASFPGTPGKKIAMIAGIPKPVGCI